MTLPLSSMTGFGRASGTFESAQWLWELKSVNSRTLDLRFRLPPGFDDLESRARELLTRFFSRGALSASLTLTRPERDFDVRINETLLNRIIQIAETSKLARPALDGVLGMKGVVEIVERDDSEQFRAGVSASVLAGLETAAHKLQHARHAEGAIIAALFVAQMETIDDFVRQAEAHPSRTPEAIRACLKDQIQPLLEQGAFDETRLYQEAVLLATRADIREELDRLRAHTTQARQLLQEGGPVGRRLDFLAQEFNREANTLCSKAHDKDLTALGLSLKTSIDQFREQAQNIE